MVALTIFVHSRIGHRPIEGKSARLDGSWLILRNAKLNADRAGAPERRIDLSDMGPLVRRALEAYIKLRAEMTGQYGDYDGWYRAASERLSRLCKETEIERVAITSLRHVALATWKRAGLAPWIIAALAGHAAARTASRHYAGARSGWALDGLPQADMARVLLLEMRDHLRAEHRSKRSSIEKMEDGREGDIQISSAPVPTRASSAERSRGTSWSEFIAKQHDQTQRMLADVAARADTAKNSQSAAPEMLSKFMDEINPHQKNRKL